MQSYTHFTLDERNFLHEKLNLGWSIRKIADALDKNPSSVSREIKRNCSVKNKHKQPNKYNYHSWRANTLAIMRRRQRHVTPAIIENSPLWNYIVEKFNLFWSPEQIVALWKQKNSTANISISTIYRYIKQGKFNGIKPNSHLRRKGKKYRLVRHNCQTIHPDRTIPEWTNAIKQRIRIGDWEGDTVYGGIGKGLLVTLVDRKSRFLCATIISSRNSSETREMIVKMLKDLPVNSISLDNGSEFSEFRKLETELNTTVYFAEPHKPWQRGTNENTNDILRFFFPKGYDFRKITDEVVQYVVSLINNRPRKCLGWKTPSEVFWGVALA